MQLQIGAEVYSVNGKKIGSVDHLVIDPKDKEITHFIVEAGFLLKEDKVVPIDWVTSIKEDRVSLRQDEDSFEELPTYQETHYIPLRGTEPPYGENTMYWYPPVIAWGRAINYPGYPPTPPYLTRTERNIPKGVIVIEEGENVFDSHGEHIGDVERVEIDPVLERVTHIVLSQGLLFKEHKLIPANWISVIKEDGIHLSLAADFLEQLPEYEIES